MVETFVRHSNTRRALVNNNYIIRSGYSTSARGCHIGLGQEEWRILFDGCALCSACKPDTASCTWFEFTSGSRFSFLCATLLCRILDLYCFLCAFHFFVKAQTHHPHIPAYHKCATEKMPGLEKYKC